MKLQQDPRLPWLVLAASLVVSAGFWYQAIHITAEADTATFLAKGRPIGNNSDLYARWLGTRELLLQGKDPDHTIRQSSGASTACTRAHKSGFRMSTLAVGGSRFAVHWIALPAVNTDTQSGSCPGLHFPGLVAGHPPCAYQLYAFAERGPGAVSTVPAKPPIPPTPGELHG